VTIYEYLANYILPQDLLNQLKTMQETLSERSIILGNQRTSSAPISLSNESLSVCISLKAVSSSAKGIPEE